MVTDSGVTTTTAYIGGTVYENGSLKFINHAEGYIEPDGAGGYDYVYQYKDHLGNVRLSYKDADDNRVIHGASTQLFFDDFEAATGWDGSGASWGQSITSFDDTLTFDGEYSGRIYGAMGTSVAVHSNEWVAIDNDSDTDYIYTAWAYSESPIIRLGLGMKEDGEAGYLTLFDDILIIDELNKWVYVEKRVTVPAHITSLNVRMECAAWDNRVGNVWFDNVSIRRVNDPVDVEIVEEKNYYPFGLLHRGYNNSVNGTHHNWDFQGQERQEELDLNWLSYKYRNYDPAIARFFNVDPLTEDYMDWAPYVFSGNRVIDARELEGLEPYVVTGRTFIPDKTLKNPLAPVSKTKSFAGDNRSDYQLNTTAYRTEQKVRVDFDNNKANTLSNRANSTIGYDKNGNTTKTSEPGKAGPTPTYTMENGTATINMEIDASNKLVPGAPAINYDVSVTITQEEDGSFSFQLEGESDGFPGYEFFITNEKDGKSYLLYGSNPNKTGDTPRSLFPPMEKDINASGNSATTKPVEEEKKN